MSRRHMTPEQKSDRRGQRYNRENRQGERTDLTSPQNEEKSTTAKRLGWQPTISVTSIVSM